jgi:predicted DNA-binding transcriptional regulator AlpA
VDIDDLVDARAVAELLGLKHANSVSTYSKRYEDFPRPVVSFGRGRTLLWLRPEVIAWARKRGRIG